MNRTPNHPARRFAPLPAAAFVCAMVAACLGLVRVAGAQTAQAEPAAAGATARDAGPALRLPNDPIDPATIPAAVRGLQYVDRLGAHIPLDLSFTDSDGRRVELGSLFGHAVPGKAGAARPLVMLLIYFRCPSQCPGMLARIQTRLNQLEIAAGDQFNFVVVSFDPTDTPAKAAELRSATLQSYVHRASVETAQQRGENAWAFLTDSSGNGLKLAEALGFPVRYQPSANEYAHGSDIFVLAPDGKLCRYLGFDPPVQTLRLSLVEASEGKIGTTLDRVLLWCFHFDPNANSYVVQAWRFMQVGGTISAVTLGLVLLLMYRIERRRRERDRAARSGSNPSSSPTRFGAGAPASA
ncbi:MAG: SCO family protein [Phycisphaerales bacterium]